MKNMTLVTSLDCRRAARWPFPRWKTREQVVPWPFSSGRFRARSAMLLARREICRRRAHFLERAGAIVSRQNIDADDACLKPMAMPFTRPTIEKYC